MYVRHPFYEHIQYLSNADLIFGIRLKHLIVLCQGLYACVLKTHAEALSPDLIVLKEAIWRVVKVDKVMIEDESCFMKGDLSSLILCHVKVQKDSQLRAEGPLMRSSHLAC